MGPPDVPLGVGLADVALDVAAEAVAEAGGFADVAGGPLQLPNLGGSPSPRPFAQSLLGLQVSPSGHLSPSHTRTAAPVASAQMRASTHGCEPFQLHSLSALHTQGTHFGPAASCQPSGHSKGFTHV